MSRVVSARRAARHGCRLYSSSSASEAWDSPFLWLQKRRGQHLLTNPRVLDDIVRRAAIRPGDAVLEAGPGTGNLTVRLLASPGAAVAAVEVDPRIATAVAARVEFPKFDVCVSNTPYAISSSLTARLLFGSYRFRTATLLVQKEFARRLMGSPGHGEHNHLATNLGLVADVRLLMDVSKTNFVPVPVPGVDSSLVEIRMKEAQPTEVEPGISLDEWLEFTRVCFGQHQLQKKKEEKKNGKGKTLGAIFKQEEMAIELFRLWARRVEEESDDHGCGRDEDPSDGAGGFSKEEFVAFKEKIAGTLQSARLYNERPSILPNNDLLKLLRLFIKREVRFH
ncbi:hypothetical protein BS78_02G289300 [Paspalum vaginatum]|nr:hypothetical protein BS78_02G289300 [Paspalum vaginatum]